MTRRRFAFWLGFGLFTLADKLRVSGLDALAAAAMRSTENGPAVTKSSTPRHWTAAENKTWRWFEREELVDGKWKLTGITTPIHKRTGERYLAKGGYLDDSLVPEELRLGKPASEEEPPEISDEQRAEFAQHEPSPTRQARHGRPPSKWLRSLHADEIRLWLSTIDVPEAGVSGMTYWMHLTRDHAFDPEKITGLTEAEQAKLHAAAHHGY